MHLAGVMALSVFGVVSVGEGRPAAAIARVGTNWIVAAEVAEQVNHQVRLRGQDFGAMPLDRAHSYQSQVLDQMIDLLVAEARADDLVRQKSAERVESAIAKERERAGSEEAFAAALGSNRTDLASMRFTMTVRFLLEDLASVEGASGVAVSDGDLHKRYEAIKGSLRAPERRRAEVFIVRGPELDARRVALRARERIVAGEAIRSLANDTNRLPPGVTIGGGAVTVRRGESKGPMADMAFRLGQGDVSAVLGIPDGLAIMRVVEVEPAGIPSLDEVRGRLSQAVVAERQEAALDHFRKRLRSGGDVDIRLREDSLRPAQGAVAGVGEACLIGGLSFVMALGLGVFLKRQGVGRLALSVFGVGVLLRLAYCLTTPYDLRANDPAEHLEYVRYVLEHWGVPKIGDGFMFYQPPAYYFLVALASLPFDAALLPRVALDVALLGSVVALAGGVWVMRLALGDGPGWKSIVGAALLAASPPLVMLGGRIGNDGMALACQVFILGLLIRWWRGSGPGDWFAACALIGIGMLVKSTTALLVPVIVGALVLQSGQTRQEKRRLALVGVLVVGLLAGWMMQERLIGQGQRQIVANLQAVSPALRLPNAVGDYLVFDPARLVRRPFVNGWMRDFDREHFWEQLFRGALFDQNAHPGFPDVLASVTVLLGLGFVGLAIAGLWFENRSRWRDAFPMTATVACFLLGHLAYAVSAPFASSHAIRYSALVLVPLVYFFVISGQGLPARWRVAPACVGWALAVLACAFDMWLIFA